MWSMTDLFLKVLHLFGIMVKSKSAKKFVIWVHSLEEGEKFQSPAIMETGCCRRMSEMSS